MGLVVDCLIEPVNAVEVVICLAIVPGLIARLVAVDMYVAL